MMDTLRYNTVLFDFHGVFTSNRGRTGRALVRAASEVGLSDNRTIRELLAGLLSRPMDVDSKSHIIDNAPQEVGARLADAFLRIKDGVYVPQFSYMVDSVAALGARIGIVSNGRQEAIEPCVQQWGWSGRLVGLYARGPEGSLTEATMRKPSAQPLEYALADMQSRGMWSGDKKRVLFVGDHEKDLLAGAAAGVDTAIIMSGHDQCVVSGEVKPYTILTTHNVSIDHAASRWGDIPVRSMRDLPQVVASGVYGQMYENELHSRGVERG